MPRRRRALPKASGRERLGRHNGREGFLPTIVASVPRESMLRRRLRGEMHHSSRRTNCENLLRYARCTTRARDVANHHVASDGKVPGVMAGALALRGS